MKQKHTVTPAHQERLKKGGKLLHRPIKANRTGLWSMYKYKFRPWALSMWDENTYGKKKETDKAGALGQVFHVAVSPKVSKGFRFKP